MSIQEIEEIKNNEDKNLQKLREEFDKKQSPNENHPKTSYGHKHPKNKNKNIISLSCKKSPSRYNKALSANRINKKINGNNDKISYNFYKKNPGYLYYKEIMTNIKSSKKRTLTGKTIKNKMKLKSNNKNLNNNNNKFKKNQKFPKINNYTYNNKKKINEINNYNSYNIFTNDKNNPYSFFWANKILNQSDFRIDIKGMAYGVPRLGSVNKKEDYFLKVYNKVKEKENLEKSTKNSFRNYNNNNVYKHYYNNFVGIVNQKHYQKEKITKEIFDVNIKKDITDKKEMKININKQNNDDKILVKNNNEKKDNNKNENNKNDDNDNEFEEESFDEEQQKQFYKNQKNFFKARKDIIEEPEYLEEDNDIIN